jgi:glycosyltransferase involved in cell wall biosynthesis
LKKSLPRVSDRHEWVFYPKTLQGQKSSPIRSAYDELIRKQFLLPLELQKNGVDVALYGYPIASFASRVPSCLIIYDVLFMSEPSERSLTNNLARHLVRLSAEKATRIVTISEFSRGEISRFLRIPRSKIHVARLGSEHISTVTSERGFASPKLSRFLRRQFFLAVLGGFSPRKNAITLIESYDALPGFIKQEYDLIVVAKETGVDWPRARQLLINRGLSNKVLVTGSLTFPDVVCLYRSASLLLHATRHDGFGLPVLEAMACGLPVIATNRGAVPEVTSDAAILVNPDSCQEIASAITALIESADSREVLRSKGRARCRQFSWDNTARVVVDALEDAYESG